MFGKWGGALMALAGVVSVAYAEPQKYISIFAKPQYPETITHFPWANAEAPKGGEMRFGALGTFDSFYPLFLRSMPAAGFNPLYEDFVNATLMSRSHGELDMSYPSIAESVEINADRTAVTFFIRKNATFHDGTPIRPEDVVFSFLFLTGQIPQYKDKMNPLYKSYYEAVTSVSKTGPYQVTFTLKNGAAREVPSILGDFPIVSEAFFMQRNIEESQLTPPNGSGPYRVSEFRPGRGIIYERVKNWWGNNLPAFKGAHNFRFLRFEYFMDETALFEAFKNGTVDVRSEASAKNWATNYTFPAVQDGRVKKEEIKHKLPVPQQAFILNLRNPLFQDADVRKALGMLIDFEWLNRQLFYKSYYRTTSFFENSPFAAKGVIPSNESMALKKIVKEVSDASVPDEIFTKPIESFVQYAYTPRERAENALSLLKKRGWELKGGVLTHPKFGPFHIMFPLASVGADLQAKVAEYVKRAFGGIGIQVQIRPMDEAQYIDMVKKFRFDIMWNHAGGSGIPGCELIEYFSSSSVDIEGGRNYAGIKDPLVDALVARVIASQTEAEIMMYAHLLDRVMIAKHYTIPLWHLPASRVAYWNRFGHPATPTRDGVGFTYWWEEKPRQQQSE